MNSPTEKPYWFPLFEHMSQNYGLTLVDDELSQIARAVDEVRSKNDKLRALQAQAEQSLQAAHDAYDKATQSGNMLGLERSDISYRQGVYDTFTLIINQTTHH
jgi:hypothetical protein